ncbi:MAG: hypothetical protein KDC85_22945 [Saprospiraceae bacterium]|nr:hypothetical protein [Saprospiraceae bacterium]MCB9322611.1 Zn-dependent hydrolase [Lewinellaceae bacterium]
MKKMNFMLLLLAFLAFSCNNSTQDTQEVETETMLTPMQANLNKYVTVRLTSDLSKLSDDQKQMIKKLIEAGKIMDDLFWYEAYGDKAGLLDGIQDEDTKTFVKINYGPWDRLDGNASFIDNIGEKPAGANFYPVSMTKEAFEAADLPGKDGLYTFIREDENGKLVTVPYNQMFRVEVDKAATLLREAAQLTKDADLKNYLKLRADALMNDDYLASDMAWMDMKNNQIDVVIGPIETYEDQLFGYKASHECYVLIKDMEWSGRLAKYAAFLPELQEALPVEAPYKKEKPGTDADLNAYDVVYYAGDCNAGSKTIAINLPNDEKVQLEKGTRRLQLKNAMQAKFDKIMVPIADVLIAEDQRQHITFDAFFSNTMFHEVAHGLGIKNVIKGQGGTVRQALKEHASALEEGKADILGLFMIKQLHDKGELTADLKDYYVTFMAGIFRSVRFGSSSAHGRANMIRFNYFKSFGAFERNADGTYSVKFDKLEEAMESLANKILTLQGDGDYDGVAQLVTEMGGIGEELQKDLDRLQEANIPVDVIFEQGADVLGI